MPVERRGLGSSRAQEAARDRRLAMSLTPPLKVQKLQTAFHAKAKGSPGYRFYALYDKVYRRDVLGQAFNVCRRHGGGAGNCRKNCEPRPIGRKPSGGCTYPSRTANSGRWGSPRSRTGWCKRLPCWCSNRSSRLTWRASSTPTGPGAALWTRSSAVVDARARATPTWGARAWGGADAAAGKDVAGSAGGRARRVRAKAAPDPQRGRRKGNAARRPDLALIVQP